MNTRTHTRARAFTIVELLISILIIGTLMGLLIVGARHAIHFVRMQADRQAVISLRVGATQFNRDHGFLVPLVRDQYPLPGPQVARVEPMENAQLRRMAVYDIGALNSTLADNYRSVLIRRTGFAGSPPGNWGALTEYYDVRWSNNSIAFYLVGALEEKLNPVDDAASDPTRPSVDGKTGFGLVAANRDGSFKIPLDIANNTGNSVPLPKIYEPYFIPNNSSTKIVIDDADIRHEDVQLRDRNGVAYRYYMWMHDETFRNDPVINKYLCVPLVVGDPATDPRLRSARFAIVGAGPNGVFGDEALPVLQAKLGMSDASELQARKKALEDNVVEFGD